MAHPWRPHPDLDPNTPTPMPDRHALTELIHAALLHSAAEAAAIAHGCPIDRHPHGRPDVIRPDATDAELRTLADRIAAHIRDDPF